MIWGNTRTWSSLVHASDTPRAADLSHQPHPGLILARRTPCAVALLGQTCPVHELVGLQRLHKQICTQQARYKKKRGLSFAGIPFLSRKRTSRSSVPKSRSASMGWVNRENCPAAKTISFSSQGGYSIPLPLNLGPCVSLSFWKNLRQKDGWIYK